MRAITQLPRRCAVCRRRIDWSGVDHHRAPGSLEDGIAMCRDCCHRVATQDAA
jgi:hypothetical protein